MVATAAALHHQGTVGVVGIEEFGHGTPRELKTLMLCKQRASWAPEAAMDEGWRFFMPT
jgi:hypothetical protein